MCSCFSSACLACRLRQVRTGCRLRSSADRSLQVLYPRGPQLWCRRLGGGMARTHLDFIHISLAPHWLDCPGRRITRGGGCGPSFFLSSPPLQHQAATVPQHFMGTKLGRLAHSLIYLPPHHGPGTQCDTCFCACLTVWHFVTMISLSVTYLPRWHHPKPAKWDKKVPKRGKPAGPSGGFNLYQGERGAIKRTASLGGDGRSRVCCLEFTSRQNVNRLCTCVFMTCLNWHLICVNKNIQGRTNVAAL